MGATVTLGCRNMQKGRDAVEEILRVCPDAKDRVKVRQLDMSSMRSVRGFAAECKRDGKIDILVNNAGMGALPPGLESEFTEDGDDVLYATNFLGSFLLTSLLEEVFVEDARVVFTSSTGQYGGKFGDGFSTQPVKNTLEEGFHVIGSSGKDASISVRYGMTKSMQVAFARSLQLKWDQEAKVDGRLNKRCAHAFTPAYTSTEIFGKFELANVWKEPLFALLKSCLVIATDVSEGGATGTWLASTNDEQVIGAGMGGGYWDRMVRRTSTADRFGQDKLDRLWARWEADVGIQWR